MKYIYQFFLLQSFCVCVLLKKQIARSLRFSSKICNLDLMVRFMIYVLCAQLLQLCLALYNSMDCSPQASLSMRFSRQEYWSGLPYPPPGSLPNPGIEFRYLTSPALASSFFTISATWEVRSNIYLKLIFVYVVSMDNFILENNEIQLFWHHFCKQYSLPLNYLGTFVIIKGP